MYLMTPERHSLLTSLALTRSLGPRYDRILCSTWGISLLLKENILRRLGDHVFLRVLGLNGRKFVWQVCFDRIRAQFIYRPSADRYFDFIVLVRLRNEGLR